MRILFLSNYYPPFEVGGYEQLCRDVAEEFCVRGHQVSILTSDHGRKGIDGQDSGKVFRLLRLRPRYDHPFSPIFDFFIYRQRDEKYNQDILNRVVEKVRPDVVFIWNIEYLPRELALACEQDQRVAVVYWLAGHSPTAPDEYWRYWLIEPSGRYRKIFKKPFSKIALNILANEGKPVQLRLDHVAVVSQFVRNQGRAEGALPDNTQVIYNGIEIDKFFQPIRSRSGKKLRAIQAGRFTLDKGVQTSIEAIALISKRSSDLDIELLVVGRGPDSYKQYCLDLVAENAIADRVKFLDWVSRDEMPGLLLENDVLLLPTRHPEPFSRAVLEGMASGLLVIASDTGGTRELIEHGVNGLMFPAGNSQVLADLLEKIALNDELRRRLARNGQEQTIKDFSLETMVDNLEALLLDACREHQRILG